MSAETIAFGVARLIKGRAGLNPLWLLAPIAGGLFQAAASGWAWGWFLSFLALIPLAWAAWGRGGGSGFRLGLVQGLTLGLAGLYWLPPVLKDYGALGLASSWLLFGLLAAYLALYPAVFGALWAWLTSRKGPFWLAALIGALWWCGLDWLKNIVFTGFNWAPLAGGLWGRPAWLGAADLLGLYGLGFLVALINLSLAALGREVFMAEPARAKVRAAVGPAVWAGLPLLFIMLYGQLSYSYWEKRTEAAAQSFQAVLVQPGVEQRLKWDGRYLEQILARYQTLNRQAAKLRPDLIIWPETSVPIVYQEDEYGTLWLDGLVEEARTPLLLGATVFHDQGPRRFYHNGALLFDRTGQLSGGYEKLHLVPFGEYIPLIDVLPIFNLAAIKKIVSQSGGYSPGRPAEPLAIPFQGRSVKVGVAICFESIFPALVRKEINRGADFLAVLTNDAWFGTSRAPYQHWNHSVFRAVENRICVVRAANTGISGLIGPSGRSISASPLLAKLAVEVNIPLLNGGRTWYQKTGDALPWAGVAGVAAGVAAAGWSRGRKKKAA